MQVMLETLEDVNPDVLKSLLDNLARMANLNRIRRDFTAEDYNHMWEGTKYLFRAMFVSEVPFELEADGEDPNRDNFLYVASKSDLLLRSATTIAWKVAAGRPAKNSTLHTLNTFHTYFML